MTIVKRIASLVTAIDNCAASGNDWQATHEERLARIERNQLPSGSGFDNGTTVDVARSTADKLVLLTSFHHMDEHGGYDGWTTHEVIVRPSLLHGFTVKVTGRDRNRIKDYIAETFHHMLGQDCLQD